MNQFKILEYPFPASQERKHVLIEVLNLIKPRQEHQYRLTTQITFIPTIMSDLIQNHTRSLEQFLMSARMAMVPVNGTPFFDVLAFDEGI